jgi:FkbM family methyltransferase
MCDFFILSQPTNSSDSAQYVCLTGKIYILPKNNLGYYVNHGLFENELIEWSTKLCKPDKLFLDIGAHTGTYAIGLASYCSHVVAFEPQQRPFYALCGSVVLSKCMNITCLQIGLGSPSQVGIQTLYVPSIDGGGASLHNTEPPIRTEPIEIRTLDSLSLSNIGFIKMDVEDNELNVILGAKNTLLTSNYPPILFEMNRYNENLVNLLNTLGYAITQSSYNVNMYIAKKQ